MKKTLHTLFILFTTAYAAYSQCVAPQAPSTIGDTITCGSTATLNASGSSGTYSWYSAPTAGTYLATGANYVTNTLTADTNFYVEGTVTTPQTQMGIPAQSSTFTGNVRGYYFVAPIDFTITGLKIPSDNPGNQNIAVMRFIGQVPLYSTVTNTFTTLFLTQNNTSTGIIPVNIPIYAGDTIGILGSANTTNSYAPSNYATTIGGQPVTLARLGMQFPLPTNPPQSLWTETGGSISRVEMYYTITCSSPRTQAHVTVNPLNVTATSSVPAICVGDSVMLNGNGATNYTWNPGNLTGASITVMPTTQTTYTVVGTNTSGCSNTNTITINVNPLPVVTLSGNNTICMGDSTLLTGTSGGTSQWYLNGAPINGATQNTYYASQAGTYNMIKTNQNGCADSASAGITVTVNALPSVSYVETQTLVCVNWSPITLTAGTPSNGTYSGTAVTGNMFDPATAGAGTFNIVYTYTDGNGCTSSDTSSITVDLCTGVNNSSANATQVNIYPNPSNGVFTIKSTTESSFVIANQLGQTIKSIALNSTNNYIVNVSDLANGTYLLMGVNNNQVTVKKIVVVK